MKSRRCSGFSLIELVMASLVVATAGTLLAGGLIAANRNADVHRSQIFSAQWLAHRLALLDDRLSATAPSGGTFLPLDDAAWTLTVEPAGDPLAPLDKATITVTRKDTAARVVTYRPVATP